MGVLTKYDQIEPIYLPQSVATYISLHPIYIYIYIYIYIHIHYMSQLRQSCIHNHKGLPTLQCTEGRISVLTYYYTSRRRTGTETLVVCVRWEFSKSERPAGKKKPVLPLCLPAHTHINKADTSHIFRWQQITWWCLTCCVCHLKFGAEFILTGSRDSAVGIATGCGLDDRGDRDWVPVGSRIFSSPRHPSRLWGPPSPYRMRTWGSSPGGKAAGAWS
jgi:hypothetical protein